MSSVVAPDLVREAALDANDVLYEVVNGKRVELPPMGVYECRVGTILGGYLEPFVREHQLGRSVIESLFRLTAVDDVQRRPDIAYVSYERWPKSRRIPTTDAWTVVPNLAVEVISPSNTADEIQAKLQDYFRAGVELVWVVYPRQQQIYVYTSPSKVTILERAGDVDGGSVLPGFKLPVAALFEDELETPQRRPSTKTRRRAK